MARRSYLTLGRLAELPPEELKAEWTRRYGIPSPKLSPDLLRLGIGYKVQEQKLGGISRSTRRCCAGSLPGQGTAMRVSPCLAS